ncbi:MAG TPA: lanthionine synthetase LanC family protein [Chloroflexota bacterium]|nr:lanthionine synthetase LanC family protein [Chloroflexota bacterium]
MSREDPRLTFDDSLGPGAPLRLPVPKESLHGAPGYYVAFGDAPLIEENVRDLVRFYFNLRASGAASVMRQITTALNGANLPFQFKVLSDPAQYTRCDAGVLYVRRHDYAVVADALRQIHREIADSLKPGTPVFTKPFAHGLGFAEDTGDDESFGLSRCRVLAEGMIRAHEQGASSRGDRLAVVAHTFDEAGIDLATPYLNPGSRDEYDFRLPTSQVRQRAPAKLTRRAVTSTVTAIARQFCREAIWDATRCTWLGSEVLEGSDAEGGFRAAVRALGPELYAGSSGVGLFLGEAYRATGDPDLRRTALGAIQHALSRVDAIPASQRIGLFTGAIGVALAAARVGQRCDDADLMHRSKELVLAAMRESGHERGFDLLSGRAGAIAGLLSLDRVLGCQPLVAFATALADELLRSAERSERGLSWRAMGSGDGPNLTGLSHGTAGVAYALLELSHILGGAPRYRRVAEEAFNYERSWFDSDVRNWPHFNTANGSGRQIDAPSTFVAHWCHGAPGIALSRLRAYRLFGDRQLKSDAIVGLETTVQALETWLATDTGNFSLCHGLAGNAEILGYASQVLAGEWRNGHEIDEVVASHGIATWSLAGSRWPCGVGTDEHPGLMVGLAGIGYYYLRLLDPTIPSILLLEPEAFAEATL